MAYAWALRGGRAAASPQGRRPLAGRPLGTCVGVDGLGVGAVLGGLSAFRCSCGGPWRSARGPRGARRPRRRLAGGRGAAGRGGSCSPLRIRVPPWGRGDRGRGLSCGGSLPGRHGLLGRRLRVNGGFLGLRGRRSDRHRGLRRSPRSAGVYPAYRGETRERERDRRGWWSSRWGDSSESNIAVILVGMRGCRHVRPCNS